MGQGGHTWPRGTHRDTLGSPGIISGAEIGQNKLIEALYNRNAKIFYPAYGNFFKGYYLDRWSARRLNGNISPTPIFAEHSNGVICFLIYKVINWFIEWWTTSVNVVRVKILVKNKNFYSFWKFRLESSKIWPQSCLASRRTWYHLWIKKHITLLESLPKISLGGILPLNHLIVDLSKWLPLKKLP